MWAKRRCETGVGRMSFELKGGRQVPLGHFISWMFRTFEDQIEEWKTDVELEQFSKVLPPGGRDDHALRWLNAVYSMAPPKKQ